MPIYSDDVKTRKAAVDGQYDDSGGRIDPTDYVHHKQIGALLPKLTEIDHAGGRVDLVKAYLSIETAGSEQADDCYTYLDKTPDDPLVDALLLQPEVRGNRAAHTDVRGDVQDYLESYQIAGGVLSWWLYGRHPQGMGTITLWGSPSTKLPGVGDTLHLSQSYISSGSDGYSYDAAEQYVKIIDVSYEDREITGGEVCGKYTIRAVFCELSSTLDSDFIGEALNCITPTDPDVVVRDCVVADSSKYYGCSGLTGSVSTGDLEVTVDSIYGYAVPSARGEAALSNVSAITAGKQTFTTGGLEVEVTGQVHTFSEEISAATRRSIFNRTLAPIPGDTAKVQFHVRIIDRWYTLEEGVSSSIGAVTV
jgi:hypothetical protein